MFERFNESARRALFFARYEASELGSLSIGAEHMLLGLTREAKGVVAALFALSGKPLKALRDEVKAEHPARERVSGAIEIPFSTEGQQALQFTADEANRLHHGYIGPEHMLLGVMRVEGGIGEQILTRNGLRLDAVREELVRVSSGPLAGRAPRFELLDRVGLLDQIQRIRSLVAELPGLASNPQAILELTQAIEVELSSLVAGLPPSE